MPDVTEGRPGKKVSPPGKPIKWESDPPVITKKDDWNVHGICGVLLILLRESSANQDLERPKTLVPWKKYAKELVKMGLVKFESEGKGGSHVKNLVYGLSQCQRLNLVEWYLSNDILGHLLPFIVSHYGFMKVALVLQDLGCDLTKDALALFPLAMETFFSGGDGTLGSHDAEYILQQILAKVVDHTNPESVAFKANELIGKPGLNWVRACSLNLAFTSH
jgi:hypothetical protein